MNAYCFFHSFIVWNLTSILVLPNFVLFYDFFPNDSVFLFFFLHYEWAVNLVPIQPLAYNATVINLCLLYMRVVYGCYSGISSSQVISDVKNEFRASENPPNMNFGTFDPIKANAAGADDVASSCQRLNLGFFWSFHDDWQHWKPHVWNFCLIPPNKIFCCRTA